MINKNLLDVLIDLNCDLIFPTHYAINCCCFSAVGCSVSGITILMSFIIRTFRFAVASQLQNNLFLPWIALWSS